MGSVIVKHHKKQQILKKKEKEDKATQEFFKFKKAEQENQFKMKLNQQIENDEQKRQTLRNKFKKIEERYVGHHNELKDYIEQQKEDRS